MKLKFFAIPVQGSEVETEALNQFLDSHQIVDIRKELIVNASFPLWSVVITYLDQSLSQSSHQRRPSVDYKEVLNEDDFTLFAELRQLRKSIADKDGVAPYNIFTNEQLAAMVQNKVMTKTALAELPGVGSKRIEKYGEVFIQQLKIMLEKRDGKTD